MMDNLRDLYQQVIVDHNRSPRNFHTMDNANCQAEGVNPLCGDQLTLYLSVNNGIIEDASFIGKGCAISMASASLMTDFLKGKNIEQALAIFKEFHDLVTQGGNCDCSNLGKLAVLSGVQAYPSRVKCATLAWHALVAALEHRAAPITTEM
jgi:nitrogen fixation NifU-like protein